MLGDFVVRWMVLFGVPVLIAALVLGGTATAARAVGFGSSVVTGVTMTPTVLPDAGTARVDFQWAVPDTAVQGDTFSLSLPDELEPAGTRPIELTDAITGEPAAIGAWSGKTVTFTLTGYADTRTGIAGTGFFYVKWDQSNVGADTETFDDLEIGGHDVGPITKGPDEGLTPLVARAAGKDGAWTDTTQTDFLWFLRLPASTGAALPGPVSVADDIDAAAGYRFDCANTTLEVDIGSTPPPPGGRTYYYPGSAPFATGYVCTTTSIELTLSQIPAGYFYTLIVATDDSDPDREVYANTAVFDWPGLLGVPVVASVELRRDDAGGVVVSDAAVAVGDYVWVDHDNDGAQETGEPGIPGVVIGLERIDTAGVSAPVLSGGAPVTATTDAAGRYLFAGLPILAPGEKYRTTVSPSQPALALYRATISGGEGFALDSSAAELYADSVLDLTVGGATDLTLDFGYVLRAAPRVQALAVSGSAPMTTPLIGAALLLLVAGLGVMRANRRSSARRT